MKTLALKRFRRLLQCPCVKKEFNAHEQQCAHFYSGEMNAELLLYYKFNYLALGALELWCHFMRRMLQTKKQNKTKKKKQ